MTQNSGIPLLFGLGLLKSLFIKTLYRMRSDVFDALFMHSHLLESYLSCCAFETCNFARLSDDENKLDLQLFGQKQVL